MLLDLKSLVGRQGWLPSTGALPHMWQLQPSKTMWESLPLEPTRRLRPHRLGPSLYKVTCEQFPSLIPHGLQEARRQLRLPTSGTMRKVFKGVSKENRKQKEGTHKSENLLCARHRVFLNKAQGTETYHPSHRKQMLREAKRLAQGFRATEQNCKYMLILVFIPQGYRAVWEGQHVSPHVLILGFEELNARQLPHMALGIHVKTSSENILNSSGLTLPRRICEKNWPSTQPAGTSQ